MSDPRSESDRISTFYGRRWAQTKRAMRERVHLLYDDRSNECIGLQVPNADVSVLAACI